MKQPLNIEFSKTIELLKSRPAFHAVKITDVMDNKILTCGKNGVSKTGAEMITEHGSVENFFESLFKNGAKRVEIINRKKNGDVFAKNGEAYFFDFVANDGGDEAYKMPSSEPSVQPIMPVLNGGMNSGMNGTIYRDMDYPRIAAELETYKRKFEDLQEKHRTLEMKQMIVEATDEKSVAKIKANTEFFSQFSPALGALAQALGQKLIAPGVAMSPGLTGTENLSPVKMQFLQLMKQEDDNTIYFMGELLKKLGEDAVFDDYEALLNKHKIIPNNEL